MRNVITNITALLALTSGSALAADAGYPTKAVRLVVPQAAGGSTDTLSRLVAQKLSETFSQQVVVDNRPGANGIIGTEVVAKAPADGYTLLAGGTAPIAINPSLYAKIPYDPVKNFTPVSLVGYSTSVLVVHPSVQATTIKDLIALARAKPGEIRYASAGSGSTPHLSAEMFRVMTGVDVVLVNYKGSTPGVTATISGETQMMFTGVASAVSHIKAGRLRALSVNGPRRSPALPDVPTAHESGLPGYEVDFWIGFLAPAGTPRPVIDRLNKEVNRIITLPDIKDKFQVSGAEPVAGTPEQMAAIIRKDIDRWAKVVKAAGMKAE